MTNRNPGHAHFERFMVVIGDQNAGKSTAIRSLFSDKKFSKDGAIPKHSRLASVNMSSERSVSFILRSPHEAGWNDERFLDEIKRKLRIAWDVSFRTSIVCAMQPYSSGNASDAIDIIEAVDRLYSPERIRAVILSPDNLNRTTASLPQSHYDRLRKISADACVIDGRASVPIHPSANHRFLADFFDFT